MAEAHYIQISQLDTDTQAVKWVTALAERALCDQCDEPTPACFVVALGSSWGAWNELLCRDCAEVNDGRTEWTWAWRPDPSSPWQVGHPDGKTPGWARDARWHR